jgi:uncharacterized protein (DUF2126 family)
MQINRNLTEQAKHQRYVEMLAEETDIPIEQVEAVYSDVLTDLKQNSEIPDFVPVFAWRRTRTLLAAR